MACVIVSSGIAGNEPHIEGTRIKAALVVHVLGQGGSPDQVAADFGLTLDEVAAAVRYIEAHPDALARYLEEQDWIEEYGDEARESVA